MSQRRVLRAYVALCHKQADWRSKLLLVQSLDPAGAEWAMAGIIAGAVVLSLETDASVARQAMQAGACDVVVNSLDEALRLMKVEVRKGAALGVALVCDPALAMDEMRERGVVFDVDASDLALAEEDVTAFDSAASRTERMTRDRVLMTDTSEAQRRWLEAADTFFLRDLDRWHWR